MGAEMSISFSRTFIRRLAYSLTVRSAGSGFLGDHIAAFPVPLVGNQIDALMFVKRVE